MATKLLDLNLNVLLEEPYFEVQALEPNYR